MGHTDSLERCSTFSCDQTRATLDLRPFDFMLEDMDLPYAESESGAFAICSAHPPVTCQIQPTCMVGKGAAEGQVVAH